MLPLAESLLNRALDSKRAAEEIDSELSSLSRRIHTSGGMAVDVAKVTSRRSELEQSIQRVRETLGEIDEIGVQVKDLDTGLLDFPCRVEDEIVLLCWKAGEPAIEHWHTVESGFKGRQPIDERFRRRTEFWKLRHPPQLIFSSPKSCHPEHSLALFCGTEPKDLRLFRARIEQ